MLPPITIAVSKTIPPEFFTYFTMYVKTYNKLKKSCIITIIQDFDFQ